MKQGIRARLWRRMPASRGCCQLDFFSSFGDLIKTCSAEDNGSPDQAGVGVSYAAKLADIAAATANVSTFLGVALNAGGNLTPILRGVPTGNLNEIRHSCLSLAADPRPAHLLPT